MIGAGTAARLFIWFFFDRSVPAGLEPVLVAWLNPMLGGEAVGLMETHRAFECPAGQKQM